MFVLSEYKINVININNYYLYGDHDTTTYVHINANSMNSFFLVRNPMIPPILRVKYKLQY